MYTHTHTHTHMHTHRTQRKIEKFKLFPWVGKIRWRRDRLPTPVFLGFTCGSAGKYSSCNVGNLGSIPRWEDPLEKGKATHSSTLAWKVPWTMQSMRSQRVGRD